MPLDIAHVAAVAAEQPEWRPWVHMCRRAAAFIDKNTPREGDRAPAPVPARAFASAIEEYVHRLVLCGPLDAGRQALVTAAIFYDRAMDRAAKAVECGQRNPLPAIEDVAQQRLFAAAYVLAAKFHIDTDVPPMSHFAYITGIPVAELIEMEVLFLRDLLGFDVAVERRDFFLMARAFGWDGVAEDPLCD